MQADGGSYRPGLAGCIEHNHRAVPEYGGRVSKVFPWQGVAAVSELLVVSCHVQTEYFDYNHWLYLEAPEKFNKLVAGFAREHS